MRRLFLFLIPIFYLHAGDEECVLPLTALGKTVNDAYNLYDIGSEYRGRYLIGDANTTDEKGRCRGVTELYPQENLIPELRTAWVRNHYDALTAQAVANKTYRPVSMKGYENGLCIGQRLLVCDIQHGSPRLIARFITASKRPNMNDEKLGLSDYYSPVNYIQMRYWDKKDHPYTEIDKQRDAITGNSQGTEVQLYDGRVPMANFMRFKSLSNGKNGNGIHEITLGAEPLIAQAIGAPVSKGCFRLRDYPAKFVRWYIPTGAKFFIYFQNEHYRRVPN